MKLSKLLRALSFLIFFLLILGGTVRNLGAGLSCPDWPLCYGKIIPPFEIGIYAEYFHRLVAGLVSILTLILAFKIYSKKASRQILGLPMTLATLLLFSQVILGGLTVLQLLKSEIVTLHLMTGTLFFGTIVYMTLKARRAEDGFSALGTQFSAPSPQALKNTTQISNPKNQFNNITTKPNSKLPTSSPEDPYRHPLYSWARFALVALFAQMILGGVVSSHQAGLACPDFPTCLGTWWPGFSGIAGIHFTHRLGATVVTLIILCFGVQLLVNAGLDKGFKNKALGILILLAVQVSLGISNVIFHLPVAVSVAHLAIAEALFALILVSAYEIRHFKLR